MSESALINVENNLANTMVNVENNLANTMINLEKNLENTILYPKYPGRLWNKYISKHNYFVYYVSNTARKFTYTTKVKEEILKTDTEITLDDTSNIYEGMELYIVVVPNQPPAPDETMTVEKVINSTTVSVIRKSPIEIPAGQTVEIRVNTVLSKKVSKTDTEITVLSANGVSTSNVGNALIINGVETVYVTSIDGNILTVERESPQEHDTLSTVKTAVNIKFLKSHFQLVTNKGTTYPDWMQTWTWLYNEESETLIEVMTHQKSEVIITDGVATGYIHYANLFAKDDTNIAGNGPMAGDILPYVQFGYQPLTDDNNPETWILSQRPLPEAAQALFDSRIVSGGSSWQVSQSTSERELLGYVKIAESERPPP